VRGERRRRPLDARHTRISLSVCQPLSHTAISLSPTHFSLSPTPLAHASKLCYCRKVHTFVAGSVCRSLTIFLSVTVCRHTPTCITRRTRLAAAMPQRCLIFFVKCLILPEFLYRHVPTRITRRTRFAAAVPQTLPGFLECLKFSSIWFPDMPPHAPSDEIDYHPSKSICCGNASTLLLLFFFDVIFCLFFFSQICSHTHHPTHSICCDDA